MTKSPVVLAAMFAGVVTGATIESATGQGAAVGQVASLRKEAMRSGQPLKLGDAVYSNDVITTGADSSVRITFADQTNLALGPSSRVVLDRFVFTGKEEFVVSATRGAFRFTSGGLPKSAYKVNTPTSTMGVRGTVVEFHVNSRGARYTIIRP
ncbi:MAG: FecR domain-containing protein [Beijerinckiaceae bacterium]